MLPQQAQPRPPTVQRRQIGAQQMPARRAVAEEVLQRLLRGQLRQRAQPRFRERRPEPLRGGGQARHAQVRHALLRRQSDQLIVFC